ncbi:FeoB-associated Cys-rich membrane protein [Cytobacillus depressus]|uniref:FeoB-associated Cys-rich membrane protein n=1 Tax=Cytobacillus depressus TaxID=1602942 RepID=A0A6L3V2Z7_9BACI|nr:FeoB-associated Cys-rich membrane protein [Cytobacillus depressus]KAB2333310.1 FeoB-associated Cys-rich membrane protein [Cytobacillus depressus]
MLISVILGALIFGYAALTVYRFVKRSKMGKCAGCSMSKNCSSSCSFPSTKE